MIRREKATQELITYLEKAHRECDVELRRNKRELEKLSERQWILKKKKQEIHSLVYVLKNSKR